MFQVQRGTVRRSIENLIQRRVLDRRPSLGTFVAARADTQPVALLQFHVPSDSDPTYLTHTEGIQDGLRESGRELLALLVLAQTPRPFLMDTLRAARPAGLILDRFIVPDDVDFLLALSRQYPCVAMSKEFLQAPMPCVRAEFRASTAALARYLFDAGCRDMLLLSGNPTHVGMRQRSDAFASAAAALRIRGLVLLPKPLPHEYPAKERAYLAEVREAIRHAARPVGICAILGYEARMALQIAKEEGLTLGRDVHVATVPPSSAVADYAGMALAVRDEVAIGREAAQLLLRRVNGTASDQEIIDVPCRMVLPALDSTRTGSGASPFALNSQAKQGG